MLEENGVTNPLALDEVPGVYTATLEDGSLDFAHTLSEGPYEGDDFEQHSTYEFDGKTVTIHGSQSETNCTMADERILQDGSLEFSNIVECAEDEAGLLLDQIGMQHWEIR